MRLVAIRVESDKGQGRRGVEGSEGRWGASERDDLREQGREGMEGWDGFKWKDGGTGSWGRREGEATGREPRFAGSGDSGRQQRLAPRSRGQVRPRENELSAAVAPDLAGDGKKGKSVSAGGAASIRGAAR